MASLVSNAVLYNIITCIYKYTQPKPGYKQNVKCEMLHTASVTAVVLTSALVKYWQLSELTQAVFQKCNVKKRVDKTL